VKNKFKIKAVDLFCGGVMSYSIKKNGIKDLPGINYKENCRKNH
jgi:hypothetical protein